MGVFITVISKKNTSLEGMISQKLKLSEFDNALNIDYSKRHMYSSSNKGAYALNFSRGSCFLNEDDEFYSDDDGAIFLQGNLLERKETLDERLEFLTAKDLKNLSYQDIKDKYIGDYSILKIDKAGETLAFSDSISTEHIFYSETDDLILVSNRIRLIRIFLPTSSTDILALSNIALIGSVLDCETSVKEIKRVPQGAKVEIRDRRLILTRNDFYYLDNESIKDRVDNDFSGFLDSEISVCTNRITAALRKDPNFQFPLSGGKDSRSLLAMILKTKFAKDITVYTNGYLDHPDVVVAKMICEHYGL